MGGTRLVMNQTQQLLNQTMQVFGDQIITNFANHWKEQKNDQFRIVWMRGGGVDSAIAVVAKDYQRLKDCNIALHPAMEQAELKYWSSACFLMAILFVKPLRLQRTGQVTVIEQYANPILALKTATTILAALGTGKQTGVARTALSSRHSLALLKYLYDASPGEQLPDVATTALAMELVKLLKFFDSKFFLPIDPLNILVTSEGLEDLRILLPNLLGDW